MKVRELTLLGAQVSIGNDAPLLDVDGMERRHNLVVVAARDYTGQRLKIEWLSPTALAAADLCRDFQKNRLAA